MQPPDDEHDGELNGTELLRRLAESRGLRSMPDEIVKQAQDAFDTREKESRVLELVYDSLVNSDITVETAGGPMRLLEFRGPTEKVELALAPAGDRCDVVGRVEPPYIRSAQVHTPTVVLAASIDDEGGFVATGIPHGPMSVRVYLGAAGRVHTDWISV